MKNQVADRLRNMASRLEPMSRENEQEPWTARGDGMNGRQPSPIGRSPYGWSYIRCVLPGRETVSQGDVARILDMSQANVSRIEREDDIYLSTLRKYVEALGGRI